MGACGQWPYGLVHGFTDVGMGGLMKEREIRPALARWENEGGTVVAPPSPPASTLGGMALAAAAAHPGAALRAKHDGEWLETSYPELRAAVEEIACGLIALGVEPGDHVAILSDTRPEWTLADLGTLCAGAVVVPVYQTSSPEEVSYVLGHSGARLIFCEDEQQLAKVAEIRSDSPRLERVVALTTARDAEAISLTELRERGASLGRQELERRLRTTRADDVATIVYTSGTTGPPKGCVLTHANLLATARMYADAIELGRDPFSIFMFLPLAHVLARITQFTALQLGGTIVYWQRDPGRLLEDLAETGPTHFPSVPRVFEKIHARATSGAEVAAPKRALLRWAVQTGAAMRACERRGAHPGALLRARHALADRLVLSKVRGLFGGRLQLALTGAAPIGREVLDFFDACGVPILEGYGMTETCAAATLNTPGALRFGTVGRALPGTEVAIAADGEVLLRGGNVFSGYYRDAAATSEIFEDGWLRTGDLGRLDDGYLTITGRKKDIIITSSGKNVSPTNIEAALGERPWISHAVVYGDNRPYLVAALTLDPDEAPALAKRLGIEPDFSAMAADNRVHAALQAEVDAVNNRLARIEQIKRFAVLERDLTQGAGELTPTMKVKRMLVYDRYRDVFENLYTTQNGARG